MSAEQTALFPRVARVALNCTATQLRVAGTEVSVEDHKEAMVARYLELKESVKEYHQIRKELKALMGDEWSIKAGRFEVQASPIYVNEKQVKSYSATRLSVK